MSELAVRLQPENLHARIGLAIARLLDHRPGDARDLLVGIHAATSEPAAALAMQVRAVAEIYMGDHQQADRLVAAAGDRNPPMRRILTALRTSETAGRLPALRVSGTM
jgi:hypothetical protein